MQEELFANPWHSQAAVFPWDTEHTWAGGGSYAPGRQFEPVLLGTTLSVTQKKQEGGTGLCLLLVNQTSCDPRAAGSTDPSCEKHQTLLLFPFAWCRDAGCIRGAAGTHWGLLHPDVTQSSTWAGRRDWRTQEQRSLSGHLMLYGSERTK